MIESTYFGYEHLDTNALYTKFNARLNELCLTAKPCGFDVGVRVIDELTTAVNDGHTFRLTPLTWTLSDADFSGKTLPSLGLKFAALPDASALVVTRVLPDGAAWTAGVRRGDVVWALDNQSLEQFSSASDAMMAIQSREYESRTITLTISSKGGTRRDVSLQPRLSGPWLPTLETRDSPVGRVGIITFYQFRTGGQVANRVHELVRQAQAEKVTAMILDVRHSAGGSAYEALGAAGAFIQEPIQMRVQSKNNAYTLEYQAGAVKIGERTTERVVNDPVRWDGPLVVLANSTARSAAEYMTFFVQRVGRARVIGEPTAGVLNTATSLMPLADGSEMAVTSARSFLADGTAHPARVTPDVAIRDELGALTNGHDVVLEAALKSLEH